MSERDEFGGHTKREAMEMAGLPVPTPRRKHSKGTPHRGVRIPDDLWDQVKAETTRQGINVSDLIRGQLRDWLKTNEGEK